MSARCWRALICARGAVGVRAGREAPGARGSPPWGPACRGEAALEPVQKLFTTRRTRHGAPVGRAAAWGSQGGRTGRGQPRRAVLPLLQALRVGGELRTRWGATMPRPGMSI